MERVAAVVLLRRDGAALLQHRDEKPGIRHPGMWVPPGGHAEPGEDLLDCARREFLEETEYRTSDLNLLRTVVDTTPGFPSIELTIYWTWYDGKQPIVCHEGQALEFVSRSQAEALNIPSLLLAAWDQALECSGLT